MPTYDYECRGCGHAFELFQSMTDPVKKKCPSCGKLRLERLIGIGAGVIFKGSGFYETDYRSDSYRKAAEADSSGTRSDNASSSGQSESRTSTTTATATSGGGSGNGSDSASSPAKGAASPASTATKGDTGKKAAGGSKATSTT